jgi:hypothetical protein
VNWFVAGQVAPKHGRPTLITDVDPFAVLMVLEAGKAS